MKDFARLSTIGLVCGLSLLNSHAREKDRVMDLRFIPQEHTGAPLPRLSETIVSKPIAFAFEDARQIADKAIIGEGTGDDGKVFIRRTSKDVKAFAEDAFRKSVTAWGIQLDPEADPVLNMKLIQYSVREDDQAVGSSYSAEAVVGFAFRGARGGDAVGGTAAGSARRYGRKRSDENCSEVLSDALKEAYANLLGNARLQAAWEGSPVEATSGNHGVSPADLLLEVQKLKGQGFSSELLVDYISRSAIRAPLTSDDIIKWNEAGMPEPVIRAAIQKASGSTDNN